jgi:hypothetical protein
MAPSSIWFTTNDLLGDQRQRRMRDHGSAEPRYDLERNITDPLDRRTVHKRIDHRQRHRRTGNQSSCHGRRTRRFDTHDRRLRRTLVQVRGNTGDAPTATNRNNNRVEGGVQLLQDFGGNSSLTRSGTHIVERRNHRGTGPGDILGRSCGSSVVRFTHHEEFDKIAAVSADSVTLLLRSVGRNVDPSADLHCAARVRNTLCMISGTGRYGTGGSFRLRQL